MDRAQYVETLQAKLSAAGLPVRTRRVQALFEALLGCRADETDQVAGLAASVVATLTNPGRRRAMWERMATISAVEWRRLAAQKACKAATRTRARPRLDDPNQIPALSAARIQQVATALLGVTPVAIQGAGHFELELEQGLRDGLLTKDNPCYELLRRLGATLRAAERQHHAAVGELVTLAGQALALVTEYPDRVEELARAAHGAIPAQLVGLAVELGREHAEQAAAIEKVVADIGLVVERAEDVPAIADRLTRRDAVGWGEREKKTATRIHLHLRQGETLPAGEQVTDSALAARSVRQARARRRAGDLIARLLVTRNKSEVWWDRVVSVGLREIELDSLGAKRIKASRQRSLAAKALEAVEQAHASGERKIEEEIAAEHGRTVGELEYELNKRPRDLRLRDRLNHARVRLDQFLTEQPAQGRTKLAALAEEARKLASAGDMKSESGEWFFDMT